MNILRTEAYADRVAGQEKMSELREADNMLCMSLDVLFPGVPADELTTLTVAELRRRYVPCPLMAAPL